MSNKKKGLLFIIVPIAIFIVSIVLGFATSVLHGLVIKIILGFLHIIVYLSGLGIIVCIPIGFYFLLKKDKETVKPKDLPDNR